MKTQIHSSIKETSSEATTKNELILDNVFTNNLQLHVKIESKSNDIFTSRFEQLSKDNPNAWK